MIDLGRGKGGSRKALPGCKVREIRTMILGFYAILTSSNLNICLMVVGQGMNRWKNYLLLLNYFYFN
jgi:hypothetical protein